MPIRSAGAEPGPTALVGLVAFLLVYNLALNLFGLPQPLYVPVNLGTASVLLLGARKAGLSWAELGLTGEAIVPGLRWGGLAAGLIALGLGVGAAIPAAAPLYADERVAGIGLSELLYRTLVRIPFGTVLLEEVAFRGVLLAAWARQHSPTGAALGSSAVFGLWHIGPVLELLRENEVVLQPVALVAVVAGGVLATGVAGLLFCLLRLRGRGLLAPVLAHTASNSLATLAAFAAHRAV